MERLPGGGWDWTVWNSPEEVRYGAAASLDAAMVAVEAAVAAVAGSDRALSCGDQDETPAALGSMIVAGKGFECRGSATILFVVAQSMMAMDGTPGHG